MLKESMAMMTVQMLGSQWYRKKFGFTLAIVRIICVYISVNFSVTTTPSPVNIQESQATVQSTSTPTIASTSHLNNQPNWGGQVASHTYSSGSYYPQAHHPYAQYWQNPHSYNLIWFISLLIYLDNNLFEHFDTCDTRNWLSRIVIFFVNKSWLSQTTIINKCSLTIECVFFWRWAFFFNEIKCFNSSAYIYRVRGVFFSSKLISLKYPFHMEIITFFGGEFIQRISQWEQNYVLISIFQSILFGLLLIQSWCTFQ